MAVITATSITSGSATVTRTTLSASDTFVYESSSRPVLILDNVTGGGLTVNIDGDGASAVSVAGVGSVDISGGYSTATIAAGTTLAIDLRKISAYLSGTITVTGGTGIEAMLLEY